MFKVWIEVEDQDRIEDDDNPVADSELGEFETQRESLDFVIMMERIPGLIDQIEEAIGRIGVAGIMAKRAGDIETSDALRDVCTPLAGIIATLRHGTEGNGVMGHSKEEETLVAVLMEQVDRMEERAQD